MINIKELVAKLKQEGVADEEINRQLEALRSEIDAILTPIKSVEETKTEPNKEDEENDEQKNARLFGNL